MEIKKQFPRLHLYQGPREHGMAVRCFHLTQTMFNDFLIQTWRCGQTRHYKSLVDSANGAMVVNGLAALSVINDAYHAQSSKDLLHLCLRSSFDGMMVW